MDSTRRGFLKLAGAASVLLADLDAARRVFADDTAGLDASPFDALGHAYSLDPDVTYLNHASIGTIPRAVQTARRRYLELCESNPWFYMWSGEWDAPREEVRAKAARLMGCAAAEVTFTHNTTETFNLLAHGLPLGEGDEVLMSSLNHDGASVAFFHLAEARGFTVRRFDFPVLDVPGLTRDDVVDLYVRQITPKTRVLVFPHVDNTVGLRHPVRELAARAREHGVDFVAVDAAQTVGMIPVDVASMGVDIYATSPHKWLQAPKGLGLACIDRATQEKLHPMWVTWGQKRWAGSARIFEDYGTRNLPEVLALGDAVDFQEKLGAAAKQAHHRRLFEHARDAVDAHPGLAWRSPRDFELGAALYAVEIRGETSGDVFTRLFREHGFVFRPFQSQGLNTIRLSPNAFNTTGELDRLFEILRG